MVLVTIFLAFKSKLSFTVTPVFIGILLKRSLSMCTHETSSSLNLLLSLGFFHLNTAVL